mmetsp:Transcript_69314/g.137443  ORF Transcript_69314/g.137443 Transcript_69314/m.137443 type:complete len:225 (+) Transcript_69314:240-914(+)
MQILVALPTAGPTVGNSMGVSVRRAEGKAASHEVPTRVAKRLDVQISTDEEKALDCVKRVVVAHAAQLLGEVGGKEQMVGACQGLEKAGRLGGANVESRRGRGCGGHPVPQHAQQCRRLRAMVACAAFGRVAKGRSQLVRAPQVHCAVASADASTDDPSERFELSTVEETGAEQRERGHSLCRECVRRAEQDLHPLRKKARFDRAAQARLEPKAGLAPPEVAMV